MDRVVAETNLTQGREIPNPSACIHPGPSKEEIQKTET
jgi:hypothetical protein